ncbi:hypothetical protein LINPERPRIM_LOCUS22258 [Linum perenne]
MIPLFLGKPQLRKQSRQGRRWRDMQI